MSVAHCITCCQCRRLRTNRRRRVFGGKKLGPGLPVSERNNRLQRSSAGLAAGYQAVHHHSPHRVAWWVGLPQGMLMMAQHRSRAPLEALPTSPSAWTPP
jgi:hypothetical protein